METGAASDGVTQIGGLDPPCRTRDLHETLIGCPAYTHDERKPRHTFGAYQADFDAAFAQTVGDNRDDAAVYEVDMLDRFVVIFQLQPYRQIDGPEVRLKQREIGR